MNSMDSDVQTFVIRKQTQTLACLLRQQLFDEGATFASCTVPHPMDADLTVKISHPVDSKACLVAALDAARAQLVQCLGKVRACRVRDK